jgi:hypothetical protein
VNEDADEARDRMLAALARKAWPDVSPLSADVGVHYASVDYEGDPLLLIGPHENAARAADAALRVLADELPAWVDELAEEWERVAHSLGKQTTRGQALLERASELRRRAREGQRGREEKPKAESRRCE